jgi:DNA-directed RNA polymerase specialized sigma subunit
MLYRLLPNQEFPVEIRILRSGELHELIQKRKEQIKAENIRLLEEHKRKLASGLYSFNEELGTYTKIFPTPYDRFQEIIALIKKGLSFKKIGDELGLSGAQVSQILNANKRKIMTTVAPVLVKVANLIELAPIDWKPSV